MANIFDKAVPMIPQKQIQNTKLIEQRNKIIDCINSEYIGVFTNEKINFLEVGTGSGDFADEIISSIDIGVATLLDIFNGYWDVHERHEDYEQESFVRSRFANNDRVRVIKGDSSKALEELFNNDDTRYDFIYLDADHSFDGVKNDLSWATKLIKDDGIIGIDDFCFYPGYLEPSNDKYEAQEAVTQFLQDNPEWKVKYFSINVGGFQNIFLCKS
jgi:SAM-dependent methyltransferase